MHPIAWVFKQEGKVKRNSVIFISDDLRHNAAVGSSFVQALITHISAVLTTANHITMYSDGASSQYKYRRPIQNFARRFENPAWSFSWNFFESHYRKAPVTEKQAL